MSECNQNAQKHVEKYWLREWLFCFTIIQTALKLPPKPELFVYASLKPYLDFYTQAYFPNTLSLTFLPLPVSNALEDAVLNTAPILRGPLKAFNAGITCRISNEEPTAERSFTVTIQTS